MSWPGALLVGFLGALAVAILFVASVAPSDHALAILLIYAFAATWFIATIIARGTRL